MNLTRHNYEEYFLLYVDNELVEEERRWVEQFTKENPDLEEELLALQSAVLGRDEIFSFGDKSVLYREEETNKGAGSPRVIAIWKKVVPAVAAALLLVGAGAFWLRQESHPAADVSTPTAALQGQNAAGPSQPVLPRVATDTAQAATPAASQTVTAQTASPATSPARRAIRPDHYAPAISPGQTGPQTAQTATNPPGNSLSPANSIPPGVTLTAQSKKAAPATSSGTTGATPATTATTAIATTRPVTTTPGTIAAAENKPAIVTKTQSPSYHTLEDADQKDDGNKILFVREDQVINGGVKGFFRRAGRMLKRSTALNSDNIHPEMDSDK